MANFTSSSYPFPPSVPHISTSSSSAAFDDNACCICLEPFTTHDPATLTSCKHEYHLHCILEWSQRSKECPICCQLLILKDSASQELLTAVEAEKTSRSRNVYAYASTNSRSPLDLEQLNDDHDDSDFDEQLMQHLVAAASRARYICRGKRQRSTEAGPSEILVFNSCVHASGMQPTLTTSPSAESARRVNTSEMFSFPESIKSKLSAASARCKESISKNTRGLKEKIIAHNASVKELSKGVQREMNAGIAGVARMIERLDLTSKRSTATGFPVKGGVLVGDVSSNASSLNSSLVAVGLTNNNQAVEIPPSWVQVTCQSVHDAVKS